MRTYFLAVLVLMSLGVASPIFGQPESVLPLEPPKQTGPPFHKGDQLEIQGDAAILPGVTRLTVLDATHWPWVLAKLERGETWLNFDHVVVAKNIAPAK